MFAGRQRRSSNVRVMQIFHELKQQFPTIPDHIVTSCIASYVQANTQTTNATSNILDLLEAAIGQEQMGRPAPQQEAPTLTPNNATIPVSQPDPPATSVERNRDEMDNSDSDVNRNVVVKPGNQSDTSVAKRPNTLDIRSDTADFGLKQSRKLQLSEKCRDVHKLLNSPGLSDKPPRSPLSAKRFTNKQQSPTAVGKKETASTPTQTTDTLVNNCLSPSVNLSLNVNCQMGLVQSPTRPKCSTSLQVTPSQPWLPSSWSNPDPSTSSSSPKSFTSVNLTLRPPSSTPQEPIDITSQNSSLTYSTSSFDRQKGLQSRLQITVGPGGGSVSSVRARPRSSYLPQESVQDVTPARTGSLNDLSAVNSEPPVLLKQQARIERMRIELRTEKAKLVIIKQEVADLEKNRLQMERRTDAEVEKQLRLEIKHLRCQCEQLALADKEEFYNNIYTGPRGPLISDSPPRPPRRQTRGRLYYQGPQLATLDAEGPKWNCSLCTFLNHPDLDKCEQCEMPRVLHGTRNVLHSVINPAFEGLFRSSNLTEAVNNNVTLNMLRHAPNAAVANPDVSLDMLQKSANALRSFSMNNVPENNNVEVQSKEKGKKKSLPSSMSTPALFNFFKPGYTSTVKSHDKNGE